MHRCFDPLVFVVAVSHSDLASGRPPRRNFERNFANDIDITGITVLALGDFNLYRLRFEGGRYVSGFAQAVNVTPKDLDLLASNDLV